ncbi:MAG: hypothetical protein FWC97_09005 [Treponema sp.]|nr:hypothetical protein [Treponema sp.]
MLQQSLNKFYSDYLSGELSRNSFEGIVYNYLFSHQGKTILGHWRRDAYEDYVSWFYPRLQRSIDAYKDVGSSFEAYIGKIICVSSKEYRARITSHELTEYSAWSAQVPDLYAHEETPVYISNSIIDNKGRKNTRRILALILKCYYYVSDDFAETIAKQIGIDSKELIDMLNEIRSTRQKRDDEIFYMKEKIHTQFLRCLVYEKKLSLLNDNEISYLRLKTKLDKARQTLEKMRERLKNTRKEATNHQIAEIIGTTKGTIDASLYKLKTKWKQMAKNADLN